MSQAGILDSSAYGHRGQAGGQALQAAGEDQAGQYTIVRCEDRSIRRAWRRSDRDPWVGPSLALKLIGECGTDLRSWPTAKHFTSWLYLAPGNKISGGKVLSSRTRRSSSRAAALLRLAATTLGGAIRRSAPFIVGFPLVRARRRP
nr:transposase [Mesorhizobium sp.]